MITDSMTIVWKEFKEMFLQRSGLRGGWLGMIIFVIVFGVFLPLQSGAVWLASPATLILWSWVPFILVNGVVADSFAGERERKTLETLLASRLSDRAILFGKLAAAIGYGWGITLVGVILAVVTINVAFGQGKLLLFPLDIGIAIVVLSFLVATMSAGLGVLISLRASSVRQAQQTLSVAFLLFFIPLIFFPMLPEAWRQAVARFLQQLDLSRLLILIGLSLVLIDGLLLFITYKRFKRPRLVLNS